MKRLISVILAFSLFFSLLCVPAAAEDAPSYSLGTFIDLSGAGASPGDNAGHGNHQTRTVHTSHGDYAAYITGTYTDDEYQTVNEWSLFKIDPENGSAKVIFTGEKYYDSSQVSLLVDKDENVWAITSTSDSLRNLTAEGLDCRAHRLDAKTGEITSYSSIVGGGTRDGYGYATCFYDESFDRIIVMHAGGDYQKGSSSGASFNWAIFDLKTNTWYTRVRYARLEARHCYMYGYVDDNGGLMLMAQRDVKAVSLGYPEIGNDSGITSADKQYMAQNGITRWAANYCWDQLDLFYFPNILYSNYVKYSVCEADYSRVTGTQEERYTLEKRLSNYYPAIQNNNGGDFLLTESSEGRKLLHITYNKAFIQAAMDRSVGTESIWYHQIWDVTDGERAVKLYDSPITVDGGVANDVTQGGGFSFRLYSDSYDNVFLISAHNGALSIYRAAYNGKGSYSYEKIGNTVKLSKAGDLINISSHRGGSVNDGKINILYMNQSSRYIFTQVSLDEAAYSTVPCSHSYKTADSLTVPPTCIEGGTIAYSCEWCLDAYTEDADPLGHDTVTETVKATCTQDGHITVSCGRCDYTETTVHPATGHDHVNGVCKNCNKKEPLPEYSLGDVSGDSSVNSIDSNLMKRIISGVLSATELQQLAADTNGDSRINSFDTNILSRYIAGLAEISKS